MIDCDMTGMPKGVVVHGDLKQQHFSGFWLPFIPNVLGTP
jgi:hypothetical protein